MASKDRQTQHLSGELAAILDRLKSETLPASSGKSRPSKDALLRHLSRVKLLRAPHRNRQGSRSYPSESLTELLVYLRRVEDAG